MAKINLLTMHYSVNNGASLQTYCTCKILKRLGHEVTIINLQDRNTVLLKYKYKGTYRLLLRYFNFYCFNNSYPAKITKRMFRVEKSLIPEADYTIIGSDQMWNTSITKHLWKSYFLDFVPDGSKRVALSTSFGTANWEGNEEDTNFVKSELNKFTAISTRESSGVQICKDYFGTNAVCLVDPTIALNDFSDIISSIPKEKEEIRCFTFKPNGYVFDVVDYIANKNNLKVRTLNTFKREGYRTYHYWRQSPKQWLEGIRDSRIFISDSFHGVACAIILRKQFIATCADEKKVERIIALLKTLQLDSRFVCSLEDLKNRYDEIMSPIDYDKVDKIIKIKQQEFIDYIKLNIK